MRGKTIFGALLVSVALCSQGFGFELLDRMLGLNNGGCGECNACAKVACCEKACPQACEKACPQACETVCATATCGKCKKCRATPVRDLFGDLKEMFEAKGTVCETRACAAPKACCPEPACCEKACGCEKCCKERKCRKPRCAEKACGACCPAACEKACPKACEPTCEPTCETKTKCHKLYRRPVVELLESIFGTCKKCGTGCEAGCEVGCAAGCGGSAPAAAPAKAPVKAPEAAPLPQAPKADPSASIQSRGVYQAAQTLVRN
jgi:hypothetical protein